MSLYIYNNIVEFNLETGNMMGWNDVSSLSLIPLESHIPNQKMLTNKTKDANVGAVN